MSTNVYPLNIASAASSLRHVFVRDLELTARIGIYDREKKNDQPVRINIDLTVFEGDAALGDTIDNVVCYEQVVKNIQAILDLGHVNLVETLAETIADKCLEDERVKVARIRVEKLNAIEQAASVGVEIERTKV